jgi:hypothetical protein
MEADALVDLFQASHSPIKETRSASYLVLDPNVLTIGDCVLADYRQSGAFLDRRTVLPRNKTGYLAAYRFFLLVN